MLAECAILLHMKRIFSAVLLFVLLGFTVVALNKVDAQSVLPAKTSDNSSRAQ